MKIAVIGAGAVGKFIASGLSQTDADVCLIGHGFSSEEILNVKVISSKDSHVCPVKVLPKISDEYDLVVFAVQTQDVERTFLEYADYLEHAKVLTVQGTVQAENILSSHFEREDIYSSFMTSSVVDVSSAEIRVDHEGQWIIGKPYMPVDSMMHFLMELFNESFSMFLSHDINAMKWTNLIRRLPEVMAGILNIPVVDIFNDNDIACMQLRIFDESINILKKAEIPFISLPELSKDDLCDSEGVSQTERIKKLRQVYAFYYPNKNKGIVQAALMKKRPTEIDFLNGELTHLAYQMRMQSPYNGSIVDALQHVTLRDQFLTAAELKERFKGVACG